MNKAKLEAWFFITIGTVSIFYLMTYVDLLSYWQAVLPFMTAAATVGFGAEKLRAANRAKSQQKS